MRDAVYHLFNRSVRLIPAPLLRRLLRTLYLNPGIAARVGYHVFPHVFYNPFPDPSQVDLAKLDLKRDLPGVDLDLPRALALLEKLAQYTGEVDAFIKARTGDVARWDRTYPPCDSGTLYAMLRHLKPKRFIEIGCGWSSRASAAALRRNEAEGHPCKSAFIEPYPPPYLTELNLPGEFIHKKIEQVPLERFGEFEAGDVLFIDTSHVIKVQNDVEYEFLHILPALKPGVIVHIHDIFTPYDYPADWLVTEGSTNLGGNNEQYALECLLSGGKDWEVILPVHLLWRDHPQEIKKLVYSAERPAAFWIRKRE
jgi:hypothetical protein